MAKLKEKDLKILKVLQEEKLCTPQVTKIAHRVREPTTTVRDRLTHMEKNGVITGYMPEIVPEKAGQELLVFVLANLEDLEHPEIACKKIAKFPFVQGVYFLVGDKDILIKIRAQTIADYQEKMAKVRKFIKGGGGIVVSRVFKDTMFVPIET